MSHQIVKGRILRTLGNLPELGLRTFLFPDHFLDCAVSLASRGEFLLFEGGKTPPGVGICLFRSEHLSPGASFVQSEGKEEQLFPKNPGPVTGLSGSCGSCNLKWCEMHMGYPQASLSPRSIQCHGICRNANRKWKHGHQARTMVSIERFY